MNRFNTTSPSTICIRKLLKTNLVWSPCVSTLKLYPFILIDAKKYIFRSVYFFASWDDVILTHKIIMMMSWISIEPVSLYLLSVHLTLDVEIVGEAAEQTAPALVIPRLASIRSPPSYLGLIQSQTIVGVAAPRQTVKFYYSGSKNFISTFSSFSSPWLISRISRLKSPLSSSLSSLLEIFTILADFPTFFPFFPSS